MTDGQSEAQESIQTSRIYFECLACEQDCSESECCATPEGIICFECKQHRYETHLISAFRRRLGFGLPLTLSEQVELMNIAYPNRRINARKRCPSCNASGSVVAGWSCHTCSGEGYINLG